MNKWDSIENIKSNIAGALNNIKDAVEDITEFTKTLFNNPIPIHYFPKLELIAKKIQENQSEIKYLKMDDYAKKYSAINLNDKIKALSNSEKANIFRFIGNKLRAVGRLASKSLEINELSIKYIQRAFDIFPEDIELAYELFNVYNDKDIHAYDEKGVEVAKLCIELSKGKNIKDEFNKIYTFIGNYYYLGKKSYKIALEYYKTARDYSEPKSYYYINAELYMAYLYDHIGEYNKSLEMTDSVLETKASWLPSFLPEFRETVRKKVSEGLTKEEDDNRVYKSNMNYTFKDSIGKYSEEKLTEAYKHYLKSEEFMSQGKRLEAVEEYKKVKELLPEQTSFMDSMISFALALYDSEKDEKKNEDKTEELFKVLNERLEIAKKTGEELCNVYNELGNAYSNKKQFYKAIDCYKKAIELSGNSIYYSNLGKCYEEMGLYDEAIAIYEKIIKINPDTAKILKLEYQIMHLKDIQEGRIGKNGEDYNLAVEHYDKGNYYLEILDYESAFKEFNIAYEINKTNLDYIFRKIMIKEIYESQYSPESDLCFEAIQACEENDDFNYLPFFLTVYGDSISYEAWGHSKEASVYYEIATYLLNLVPVEDRFAAPYYKLFRAKEQENQFEDALNLLKQVNEIDKSYKIDKDVNRVLSQLRDGGESNKEQENKYLNLIKRYLSAKSYDMVIFDGKKALEFAPNNVEIYNLICQAAERKRNYYYMKWAAKEGLRLSLAEYDEKGLFYYLIYLLGLCCKFENKKEQAKYYFELIVESDEYKSNEVTSKAEEELFNLKYS